MGQVLRPYQNDAIAGVFREWESVSATLGVAATGSGKTSIFVEIIRQCAEQGKRAIILCHRTELVTQARNRLEEFGLECEIEQADQVASTNLFTRAPVVIATPQTLFSGRNGNTRMKRFNVEDFGILICDEAHHYIAEKFHSVIAYFQSHPKLKVLGVTATPDRADALAMSKIFQSVAFDIEICDMIDEGYLVPIKQQMIRIEGLDFSACRTTAGDLNGADLARIMEQEKTLQGVASATIEICGDRRTLVFTASVKQAEQLCEIFNRHKPGKADWICANTQKDLRKESLTKFETGATQIMVNCGILTEGYDNPKIEVVVSARPTKSRSLYSQIVGRGTRPLPKVIDGLATKEERCAAILASPKPALTVLDFVGNSGRHLLVTCADILGGKTSEEAKMLAKKRIQEKGEAADIRKELTEAELDILREVQEQERRAEAARKAGLVAKATFRATYVDPFAAFARHAEKWQGFQQTRPLTEKQRKILIGRGKDPDRMTLAEACEEIKKAFMPTDAQRRVLVRAGYTNEEVDKIKKGDASACIVACKNNGWKRPQARPE